jgi:hypothetical protein
LTGKKDILYIKLSTKRYEMLFKLLAALGAASSVATSHDPRLDNKVVFHAGIPLVILNLEQ